VWTDWKARQDNQAALDVPPEGEDGEAEETPSATEAVLEAWRKLVTALADAIQYINDLATRNGRGVP
jgi:hypothetical protein